MHVNMQMQSFGEYPSPSDGVTRGWADVVSIYIKDELGCDAHAASEEYFDLRSSWQHWACLAATCYFKGFVNVR